MLRRDENWRPYCHDDIQRYEQGYEERAKTVVGGRRFFLQLEPVGTSAYQFRDQPVLRELRDCSSAHSSAHRPDSDDVAQTPS
jgi:hypothetical protein